MAISLPPESRDAPLRFGPTRLPLWKLRRQRAFDVVVSSEGDAPPLRCAVTRLSGELLEALTLPSPEAFFDRIQLHHRRYKDPRLLMLGAISAYGRFADFEVRAAALTIPAHRLLERDFRRFDAHDLELMRWICDQGLDLVDEGAGLLARTASPKWTLVRWTVSLATVCGLLSICQDRLDHATRFFGVAASQTERVTISPVSALNLVNACFIHGLLLAAEGAGAGPGLARARRQGLPDLCRRAECHAQRLGAGRPAERLQGVPQLLPGPGAARPAAAEVGAADEGDRFHRPRADPVAAPGHPPGRPVATAPGRGPGHRRPPARSRDRRLTRPGAGAALEQTPI
ncbi:hypothetical protein ACFQY5_14280 [Paeniroseomonas aquatica]|uniref:hypothetical protein n=1 Tax=Paeniroseomonas aquatica TaxID=373043 RepID=UPI00360C7387